MVVVWEGGERVEVGVGVGEGDVWTFTYLA